MSSLHVEMQRVENKRLRALRKARTGHITEYCFVEKQDLLCVRFPLAG